MAYCTKAEIESAIGGAADLVWITDPANSAVDTDAVTSAIEAASAIIDSFASGTPGTGTTAGALWESTPIAAKHAAIAIAVYKLYQRIRREEIPEGVVEEYKRYTDPDKGLLALLAKGKISWYVSEPPAAQNVATVYSFNGTDSTVARSTNPRRTMRFQLDKI